MSEDTQSAIDMASIDHGKKTIPLKPRPKLFPRSVLGITAVVLAFSIGATLSGVVLFGYYDFREKDSAKTFKKYVEGFNDRFDTANKTLDAQIANGQAAIKKSLEPLQKSRADGETIAEISKKFASSVWFVSTLDDAGQPSVGTAFAVQSDGTRTLLVTSYAAIKTATRSPGPAITVTHAGKQSTVDVQNWDEKYDLALLILKEGGHVSLPFVPTTPPLQPGVQIFALSGLGANGATAAPGFALDVTGSGIQHNIPVGPQYRGAPIIDVNGNVMAVASLTYSPSGFAPSGILFSPLIRSACERVLSCPSDNNITAQ